MRFGTRTFLLCFIPFAILLTGSFWAVRKLVESTVKSGIRQSLRENELSIARLRSQADLQNSRFLSVAGENASLIAGLQLLQANPTNAQARNTVEDQLRQLCEAMGFDVLSVSDPRGAFLAGVLRTGSRVTALPAPAAPSPQRGLMTIAGSIYRIATVPIDQNDEELGQLSVGERFDLSAFHTQAALLHDGNVVQSNVAGSTPAEIQTALAACGAKGECELRLAGQSYISLPLDSVSGDGYQVRSLQNVDEATGPLQAILSRVFLIAFIGVVLVALLFSFLSSRTISKPVTAMISHLRESESTGMIPEFTRELSPVREIRELISGFNRAAAAIRDARENLNRAYLEFVGSLAHALDARDRYTAGHSGRVSAYSRATAAALGLSADELQEIRTGALLHDIGKIGIADAVLQKPAELNDEEVAIVRQHPEIGRRILAGVQGFAPYLPAVELHHENWDGSGYPHGQAGEETPLAARIIHVCDAYDAMTTDRPYRRGMSHAEAIAVLRDFAGRQFDPRVVDAFTAVADALVIKNKDQETAAAFARAGGA